MSGIYLLCISLCVIYAILRIGMLIISFLGYNLISPSDGKEFIVGTLVPDFFFLFIFCIFSLLYFNNSGAVFAINLILLIILLISVLPRIYIANTYYIIEGENSENDYAISYTLHYDGYTVYTYNKVAPFIYKPQGEYDYKGSQYGDIKNYIYEKDYEIKDGGILIFGNYQIPLK
ncbi:hypothetical protein [Bacillus sp. J14TS2]|uniref:hypothetical protein n=1 Tax=Bacillus sp. J14TS2 TaxID=2807188 RepID=UPI001BB34676|nr:hypothetical protein [Bacillus sp. J14TS2]